MIGGLIDKVRTYVGGAPIPADRIPTDGFHAVNGKSALNHIREGVEDALDVYFRTDDPDMSINLTNIEYRTDQRGMTEGWVFTTERANGETGVIIAVKANGEIDLSAADGSFKHVLHAREKGEEIFVEANALTLQGDAKRGTVNFIIDMGKALEQHLPTRTAIDMEYLANYNKPGNPGMH